MILLIGVAAVLMKWEHDNAKYPDKQKMALLKRFPEIECRDAKFSVTQRYDAQIIMRIVGSTQCSASLKKALTSRGYQRQTMRGRWAIDETYRSQKNTFGSDYENFVFRDDDKTITWSREWS